MPHAHEQPAPAAAFDLSPQNFEQAQQLSAMLANSDLVPEAFKAKPGNCLIAMQWGADFGLKPLRALQSIVIVDGRAALWADALASAGRPAASAPAATSASAPADAAQLPLIAQAPAADENGRLMLGQINDLFAPMSITADGLAQLGFPHVETKGSAKLYRASDVPAILAAAGRHLQSIPG